ncbi:MAG: VOC family protein [Myxococcota bacterium]
MADGGRLGLGPVDQVSYVVADLGRSLPRYEALFGPFEVGEAPLEDCLMRGGRADCTLKVAVNRSGPIEIELIQVLAGDAPHREHLREHGEGLHHVRFRVDALDPKLAELSAEGFETVLYKRFGPTLAFAYLEAPAELGGSVIELLEMP